MQWNLHSILSWSCFLVTQRQFFTGLCFCIASYPLLKVVQACRKWPTSHARPLRISLNPKYVICKEKLSQISRGDFLVDFVTYQPNRKYFKITGVISNTSHQNMLTYNHSWWTSVFSITHEIGQAGWISNTSTVKSLKGLLSSFKNIRFSFPPKKLRLLYSAPTSFTF